MRILPSVAGLALVALLLTGCLPQQPTDQPTPLPSSTPVFASDEDALAAAEAAYARYVAVSDAILQAGGANPDRIDAVVVPEIAATEKEGYEDFRSSGYRSLGDTTFRNVTIQEYNPATADGIDLIRVYLCSDVSGVDVVDSSGKSVVPPTRPSLTAFEVGFDLGRGGDSLVVSSKDVWTGGGICG